MSVEGKLTGEGEFKIERNIDTTAPSIQNGIIAHYPFDGTLTPTLCKPPNSAKVLMQRSTATTDVTRFKWFSWFLDNCDATETTTLSTMTVEEALNYDLIVYDCAYWPCDSSIISKLKVFTDAGVSCLAVGNDTRTTTFVKAYSGDARGNHTLDFTDASVLYNGEHIISGGTNSDVIGGIDELQNGAVAEYWRTDSNQITGYTYTSPSGAIFYFDQEGVQTVPSYVLFGFYKAYAATHSVSRPNRFRYIRDYVNGSTANTDNHWVEIQAYSYDNENVALGKTVTASSGGTNLSRITDGSFSTSNYASAAGNALHYVQIDLGAHYSLKEVRVWHYFKDRRTYYETQTQVSVDGATWYDIFDSDISGTYQETPAGISHKVDADALVGYTKTYDGLAIEDATTNLYEDGNFAKKELHPVRGGNTWSFPSGVWTPSGSTVVRLDPRGTDNTSYMGKDIPVTKGDTYAFSCWMYVSPDCDTTNMSLYTEGAFGGAPSYYDLSKKGTWQKLQNTKTITSDHPTGRLLIYELSKMTKGFVLTTDIQVEEKNFATEYTERDRISAIPFVIPIPELVNCTVVGQFLPKTPLNKSYLITSNQSTFFSFHNTVTGGNCYYRHYLSGSVEGGNNGPFLDPDGVFNTSGGSGHIHDYSGNDLYANEVAQYMLTKEADVLTFIVKQRGVMVYEHIMDIGDTFINEIRLGESSPTWNAVHSDVSIYDRVLTDKELNGIFKTPFKVTDRGVIARGLNTVDVNIPNDAYLFNLTNNSNERNGLIIPSQDTADYTDDQVYVGGNSLEFNLFDSIDMDWSGDWSICYMKKPIGTAGGATVLTNYNLESVGSNSNSVGGGYIWWGKTTGSNSISNSTNGAFAPDDYFNYWHHVTVVKSGTRVTIETWLKDKVIRTRSVTVTTALPNYYVCHHGYDFKLGGWDNNSGCHSYFANLMILKRAMTDEETDNYYQRKMQANEKGINIQKNISTNERLN